MEPAVIIEEDIPGTDVGGGASGPAPSGSGAPRSRQHLSSSSKKNSFFTPSLAFVALLVPPSSSAPPMAEEEADYCLFEVEGVGERERERRKERKVE